MYSSDSRTCRAIVLHIEETKNLPEEYNGRGAPQRTCSNNVHSIHLDIGGVLDRMSKKNRRRDFLLQFTVFSYCWNLLNKGFF
jgi:hypothetical protein